MDCFGSTVMTDEKQLLEHVCKIAVEAGSAVMEVYGRDFSQQEKDDKSPLTEADLASHKCIVAGLQSISNLPVLSEEGSLPSWEVRSAWDEYWIIDPLDGTKEFIKRNGEFTINIALVRQGKPTLGVVYAPALDTLYFAEQSLGAFKLDRVIDRSDFVDAETISVGKSPRTESVWRVVGSRSHGSERMDAFVEALGAVEMVPMGSSLKLCLVADGQADLYPRLAPTSEWDTAAAHAVVLAAGGLVLNDSLQPLAYNQKEDILNPHFIVCANIESTWASFF